MVGRALEDIYPNRASQPKDELLQVLRLKKEGRFQEVSFSLARREILGIFGLVGSGRSDLARCLFGAEPASSGEVLLAGKPVRFKSPRSSVATGLAFVTEDRQRDGLVLSCSIRDNVGLATMRQMSRGILLNRRLQGVEVHRMVEEMAIRPPQIGKPVKELSGGNQQKVVLAKWLMAKARLLILDEPTRGVDVATKVDIYHLIGGLADQGVGIILISSELPEILGMCDRILIMREGRLVGEFGRQQATEEGLLACAAGVAQ
jgi:ABC-type sugar transport system ATPase subunit